MLLLNKKELYIISCLSGYSLLLARSILSGNKDASVLFTSANEASGEHITEAKKIKCSVTKKTINELPLERRTSKERMHIVLINPDENENLHTALSLVEKLRDKVNAEIYSFNSSQESEYLFDSIYKGGFTKGIHPIKLRRVNTVRNQIYLDLLNNSLFDNAAVEFDEKIISVLIVGLGTYGMEMLKAVLWCGQMDGYVLRVHVIDKNPKVQSVFYHQCPGIKQRGTQPKSGEDYYEIYFHGGIDVETDEFDECVKTLPETTFAFISLGDETINLKTAIKLRSLFSGMNIDMGKVPEHEIDDVQKPRILTVIHNPKVSAITQNNLLSNFKEQRYQIESIGTDTEVYSYDNIFSPMLETMALRSHMQWGSADEFNNYEYNRRSSMASSIHKKYRDQLMDDDESKDILEHKRWNAYMRSTEGYSFGYIRDDLAHRHPLLVKYDNLSRVEKDKDTRMNFKPGETVI